MSQLYLQLWDIRNFKDKAVHQFRTPTPATSLDLSQRDFLAVGFGPNTWVCSYEYYSHARLAQSLLTRFTNRRSRQQPASHT